MGGLISYTIGGSGSRIGLRVLNEAGKMVSASPYSEAQAKYFADLKSAARIAAAETAKAEADAQGKPFEMPKYDKWHACYLPVPDDMLPDRVSIKPGKQVDGFYSDEGIVYVCGRVKGIIEEFDPNTHQFKKLDAIYRDGTTYDADAIYAFKACQMLNAVDDSHPNFKRYGKSEDPEHALTFAGRELFEVNAKVVGNAGMWYEKRMHRQLFCSDALLARLRAEKIPGWELNWGAKQSFIEK